MIRAAIAAFVMTVSTAFAADDAAVVKSCLDIAAARKEAAAKEQDTETKPGPEAYLDAAARAASYAPENCIGIVAGPCMQTEEGASTYGMLACIERETDVWDARLNAAYREAIKPPAEPAFDAATAKIVSEQPRKIQQAWIPWRDATCEVLYSDGIPIYGSLSKVEGAYCYLTLTARQALWLEGTLVLSGEN